MICVACGAAYTLKDLPGHLSNRHELCLSSQDKLELTTLADEHRIHKKPNDGPLPNNHGPPVELLTQSDGLACDIGTCVYACIAQQSLASHRRECHTEQEKGLHFRTTTVQTLYCGVGKVYFAVDLALKHSSSTDTFAAFLQHLGDLPLLEVSVTVKGPELSPLEGVTQWRTILGQHAQKRALRTGVIALVNPVSSKDPILAHLPRLCREYLVEAQVIAQASAYVVRKALTANRQVLLYNYELAAESS